MEMTMTVKTYPAEPTKSAEPAKSAAPKATPADMAAKLQEVVNHLSYQQAQNAPITDVSIETLRSVIADLNASAQSL